jgi:FecR-like protein
MNALLAWMEGSMKNIDRASALSILFAFLAASATQALATTAGVFQFTAGDVRVVLAAGSERPATKGSPVSVGDTVTTARASTAQIKMGDGAIIVVQPESRLTVAEYRYAGKEDGTEKVRFRLEQGGFRSVTGAIGHTNKGNYTIETAIAHIGVRGTDHESWYFPSAVVLNGVPTEAGLYNKVNVGLTYIQTSSGEVAIAPNQVGYAASALDQPHLLGAMPGFFNSSFQPRSAQRGGSQIAAQGNAWGVNWGTWQGGLAAASARAGNSQMPAVVAANLPATAQEHAFPPVVFTATYNYRGQGGVVTNGLVPPTLGNVNSLTVGVNLTTATVTNYSVNATLGAQNWQGSGSGSFSQFNMSGPGISLNGTCSGCTTSVAQGTANGGFAGGNSMTTNFSMSAGAQSIQSVGNVPLAR